jgi:hypothetical protein
MNPNYLIEFQPQLAEEAVLRVMANYNDKNLFWLEREQLYEDATNENHEKAFNELHERWFNRLGLSQPLQQIFALWPILSTATSRCLLIKARAKKSLGAELYLAPEESGLNARERRTIVVQLTPELLAQPCSCLEFLRHEFLHIVDMLDPRFGYEPHFPRSDAGPAYDHFLKSRYSVLWDITIDGRLQRQGWFPLAAREKHFVLFKRAFQGSEEKLSEAFSFFFDCNSHTHRGLMEFAQHPEKWLAGEKMEIASKGRCALCHFPTFHLVNSIALSPDLRIKIQQDYPAWNPEQPICLQCADLYETRAYTA